MPAGSGNALALDLGWRTPIDAARRLVAGTTRRIDVARVDIDGRILHSVNVLAWGAAARIDARAERLRWVGGARYTLAAAIELLSPRLRPAGALVDGQRRPDDLLGIACNTRYSGRGMLVAPAAELDDGLLDLITFRLGPRLRLARLLRSVFAGGHVDSPLVTCARADRIDLPLSSMRCS